MKRNILLVAVVLGALLAVISEAARAGASETHLQIQNQAVNRNRPGVAEQCIYFDPGSVHIGHFIDRGGIELVAAPLRTLSTFDNRDDATRSLKIIRYFGANELCLTGNAKFSYMLVSGKAPRGKIPGEKQVSFNPDQLKTERIAGEWRIANGTSALFRFGTDEAAARQALRAIQYYGFNTKCTVGGEKGFVFLCAVPQLPRIQKKPYLEAKVTPSP